MTELSKSLNDKTKCNWCGKGESEWATYHLPSCPMGDAATRKDEGNNRVITTSPANDIASEISVISEAIKSIPIKVIIGGKKLTVYHNDETALEAAGAVLDLMPPIGELRLRAVGGIAYCRIAGREYVAETPTWTIFDAIPTPEPVMSGDYKPDLNKCPECGGVADNGHDRCDPPNPYSCKKCHVRAGCTPIAEQPDDSAKSYDVWWERFYAEHCETPTSFEAWQAGVAWANKRESSGDDK